MHTEVQYNIFVDTLTGNEMYSQDKAHYDTNPCADICEYFDIDWDEVWTYDWHVPYERTVRHVIENRKGDNIVISLYRMPSGTYEATCYNAGRSKRQ